MTFSSFAFTTHRRVKFPFSFSLLLLLVPRDNPGEGPLISCRIEYAQPKYLSCWQESSQVLPQSFFLFSISRFFSLLTGAYVTGVRSDWIQPQPSGNMASSFNQPSILFFSFCFPPPKKILLLVYY